MDIEEFYDADPRRRSSAEVEFGRDWRDAHQVRYELSWVEDTGELYVMREPALSGWATPFGGVHTPGTHRSDEDEVAAMEVVVVATVVTREAIEGLLDGWGDAMASPDSVGWLVDRLRTGGVLAASAPTFTT